ncbi:MAG: T9SS type A sorting domain-containing protein [Bacteroidota bacterium]
MKQTILLLVLLVMGTQLGWSQKNLKVDHPITGRNSLPVTARVHNQNITGFETSENHDISVPPANNRFSPDAEIGVTRYDLQSNSSMPPRVHNWGNGKVSAAFMVSKTGEPSSYTDRGTGYNTNASGAFNAPATVRQESVRTGFPAYAVSPNGEEWITTHASGNVIHYAHRAAGATAWIEGNIPTTSPKGGLWTNVALGGPDGKTVHVIYATTPATPASSGGVLVDGLDVTVKYCRSKDNGATWDIIDATLPTLNGDNYVGFTANCYSISAYGNTVAIGIFHVTDDVIMFKSEDNGTTWANPRIVHNFPLTKWSFDDGYTFDQISSEFNPDIWPAPNGVVDSFALLTNDNTGNVLVDANGVVHVAFSSFFIRDPDTAKDASYSLYPGTNLGIIYWNDLLADNAGIVAAYCPDLNGDGQLGTGAETIYYTGYYGMSLSTLPTLGMDADGRVYLSYISNDELTVDPNNNFYKQPFIAASSLDWTSFSAPQPVLQADLVEDSTLTAFTENFFASIATKVDSKAHIVWQQDFTVGVSLRVSEDVDADNSIRYIDFPVIRLTGTKEQNSTINAIALTPNPAVNNAQLSFELKDGAQTNIAVYNIAGQRVMEQYTNAVSGKNVVNLNTTALRNGVYFVRLNSGAQSGTVKLTVAK